MVLGWQDWNLLRRSDGTLVFRALWKLRNGSELDLSWRQLSLPTAGAIQGFAPLSPNASDAARFSDDGFGPECTSFRGLGLSSEPDTCVLDGSGLDACHFSCIGAISPYVDPASSQGRLSIPGPFTLLTSALTLWVMEGSTSFAQQGGGTPVQEEVSANMTLEVENPNAFVANPSMRLAIVLTLSPLLAVPSDWISLDLGIETRSRRLPQNSGGEGRELQLASLVRVGVTVALQSSTSSKSAATEATQGTQSTQKVVTSSTMAQNLQSLAPNQVATGISQNAQQISGQPVVVKVQEISPPQVSKVNSGNSISTSSPASQDQGGDRGTIGVVRKGGCSGQGSVALAATASLFSLSFHFRSL